MLSVQKQTTLGTKSHFNVYDGLLELLKEEKQMGQRLGYISGLQTDKKNTESYFQFYKYFGCCFLSLYYQPSHLILFQDDSISVPKHVTHSHRKNNGTEYAGIKMGDHLLQSVIVTW